MCLHNIAIAYMGYTLRKAVGVLEAVTDAYSIRGSNSRTVF